MATTTGLRPFQNGMRSPIVAPVTRGLIALPLVFLTTQTDKYFAWTIVPPLTAAILGANYVASTVLAMLAARKHLWAHGRISVSVALAFAPITTAATLMHIDKFHLDSFFGWFWVVAYTIYPPMLLLLLWKQLRIEGGDPPRAEPLAGWVKALLMTHAIFLLPLGLVMFVAPSATSSLWPWELTPLTSRTLSAWVIALGVLGAHSVWENDLERVKVAFMTYPVFGLMQLVGIARFNNDMQWNEPGAWVYVGMVASTFIFGAYAWARSSKASPAPA